MHIPALPPSCANDMTLGKTLSLLELTLPISEMGLIIPLSVRCRGRKSMTPVLGTQEIACKRGGCRSCRGGDRGRVHHHGFHWREPSLGGQLPCRLRGQTPALCLELSFPPGPLEHFVCTCFHSICCFHLVHGVIYIRYHFSEVRAWC